MEETTTSLAVLAGQIHVDLKNREDSHQDWVEATMSLIMHLAEGRARFPSNDVFGEWLDENGLGLDRIGKTDRAAAIKMAQDLSIARAILQEGRSKSLEILCRDHMEPRMATLADFNRLPIDRKTATDGSEPTKTSETPAPEPDLTSVRLAANRSREGTRKQPQNTSLIKKHGDAGRIVNDWLERGTPVMNNGRPQIKPGHVLAKLSKKTIKELAKFVSKHSKTLPPARSQTDNISLKTFWQEAPMLLVKRTIAAKDERTVLNIIDKWKDVVAPILEQWRTAGSPADSDDWYNRTIIESSLKLAPLSANASALYAKRAAEISEPVEKLAKSGHDQWPLPPPEPIKVHGLEIWPTADERYDWRAAYYGFSLYYAVADITQEKRLKTQARTLLNPLGPLLAHINGPVGVVWRKICVQIFDHPELADDTCGPGKTLQGY